MPSRIRTILTALAAVSVLGVWAVAAATGTASAHEPWARASLRSADGTRIGSVSFYGDEPDLTSVSVRLRAATGVDAFHGLHIHANDSSANGDGCIADAAQPPATWFVSADGHWKHDPNELHGHHAGDLPSVYVNADGTSTLRVYVDKLTPDEIVGRAVVLHVGPDNFANVPVGPNADQYSAGSTALAKTQATGNAGDRFACGVVRG